MYPHRTCVLIFQKFSCCRVEPVPVSMSVLPWLEVLGWIHHIINPWGFWYVSCRFGIVWPKIGTQYIYIINDIKWTKFEVATNKTSMAASTCCWGTFCGIGSRWDLLTLVHPYLFMTGSSPFCIITSINIS